MIRHSGLGTRLRRLLNLLDGDVQGVYDELGIPFRPRFFPIVQWLRQHDAVSVNDLAAFVGVSQPAITQTLGEMRKLDLVRSRPDSDRRLRLVQLSDKGRALAKELDPVWQAVEAAAADLDKDLPIGLADVLDGAIASLQRRPFAARIHDQLERQRAA